MPFNVKVRYNGEQYDFSMSQGATVADVLERAGAGGGCTVLVNGRRCGIDTALEGGDDIVILPAQGKNG